jgi:hypothetical protein
MKRSLPKIAGFAAAGLFGFSTMVSANHLTAPTGVVCPIGGNMI